MVRRSSLPSGDLVVTLVTREGRWRGIARKARTLGGTQARLSLFHEVRVQGYRRRADDLAVVTQATLQGALPRLTDPAVYPFAHLIAELAERTSTDAGEASQLYDWVASALRGLDRDEDPWRVSLVHAWMILRVVGFGPVVESADVVDRLDVAAGVLRHGGEGVIVDPVVGSDLVALATGRARDALSRPFARRDVHLRLLDRYVAWHVDTIKSFDALPLHAPAAQRSQTTSDGDETP